MIATVVVAALAGASKFYFFHEGFRYARAVLSFAATAAALRPLEALRVRLAGLPAFETWIKVLMILGFLMAFIGAPGAKREPAAAGIAFAGSVMAACSFAFSYPTLRGKWRRGARLK